MSEPKLHVDARGAGPLLALAHGFGGSARNFRGQLRRFADVRRVVAWDARGHARSEAPSDPAAYSLDTLVADVARVLDGEGADEAVVGGLSLGAATALAFAQAHPERVRGLVLASFPAPRRLGGFAPIALPFADAIDREGLEAAGARFVWGPDSGLDPRGAALVRQGFLEHPPHALAAILRGVLAELPDPEVWAEGLGEFDRPVLLIAGGVDGGSVASTRALAAALPRARSAVIPDAGHVVNLAAPAAFDTELEAFLAELGS